MTSWGITVGYGPTRQRLLEWLPGDRWHHIAWIPNASQVPPRPVYRAPMPWEDDGTYSGCALSHWRWQAQLRDQSITRHLFTGQAGRQRG